MRRSKQEQTILSFDLPASEKQRNSACGVIESGNLLR
jgi:hypothetical protein